MLDYYDYVLVLIPGLLFGVTTVLALLGTPSVVALSVGAGASMAVVAHALFVRSPVERAGVEEYLDRRRVDSD